MTVAADPVTPPYALTVASSDSGGGAGIQADLKTMTRLGVYGGSVVVGVTAQNTRGVESTHVLPPEEVRAQYEAVTDDFDVGAMKTGMLATTEAVETVAACLADYDGPVVVDPVMVATSGDRLLATDAVDAYDDVFAQATLVTPNADETEVLTGVVPDDEDACAAAADWFFERGTGAVLLKGGHVEPDDDAVRDVLVTPGSTTVFENPRVDPAITHGSGCTLSSAVAAHLARGEGLEAAVDGAIEFVHATIERPADVGAGPGSVNHLVGGDWTGGEE